MKKVVVVVTDSFSSRGIEITKELTDRMKANHVKLFSVGASARVNKPELDEMVSKPSDTHELIVDLKTNSFSKDQVEQFSKKICKSE